MGQRSTLDAVLWYLKQKIETGSFAPGIQLMKEIFQNYYQISGIKCKERDVILPVYSESATGIAQASNLCEIRNMLVLGFILCTL